MRSSVQPRERSAIHCFQIGLLYSYSRWVSQCGAFTRGGPSPVTAYARRVPSKLGVKRMAWAVTRPTIAGLPPSRAVAQLLHALVLGAVVAAEHAPVLLQPVAD